LNGSAYHEGFVTLARLASGDGQFKMHVAGGEAVAPPKFHEVGCPTYPIVAVELDGDTGEFMQNLCSQHYAIVYGDVRDQLRELCRILDVRFVA
jgi:L-fucose isomerase-like protein